VQKLTAASAECSSCLNRANKVAYTRLDHVFGARGNGAFRLDAPRFFHTAVVLTKDTVKVPEACCKVAAEVLSQKFQDNCACRPEVVQYTKWFDKELMDYCEWALRESGRCSDDDLVVVCWCWAHKFRPPLQPPLPPTQYTHTPSPH